MRIIRSYTKLEKKIHAVSFFQITMKRVEIIYPEWYNIITPNEVSLVSVDLATKVAEILSQPLSIPALRRVYVKGE